MTSYDMLFAGVGGQGVITASGIVARAAIASGLDVRMYGSYGMAQRGGSVSAHLRIGERVLNARLEKGGARLLVGLELIEAVRWAPFLSGEGVLLASDELIPPLGRMIEDGGEAHRRFLRGFPNAILLDAVGLAGPAGSRGVTAVMLGAASSVAGFPVKAAVLEKCLREEHGAKAGPFLAAFRKGGEEARSLRPKPQGSYIP